jgi:hypothetical protein
VNQSGGGVASVAGTGAISSTGGTAPVISIADAGTATVGAVQLSDSTSTTSSVLAATPTAVKSAYDLANLAVTNAGFEAYNFSASGVIGTFPRFSATLATSNVVGQVAHTKIVPHKDFTVSNIKFTCGNAQIGATLVRFGIYTRSGTTFTLVARTANDTTIFATAQTSYTRALATAGGYPATYAMTAGTEYWLSIIIVGASSLGQRLGAPNRPNNSGNAATGGQLYTEATQTDLPATSTGVIDGTGGGAYVEVS